MSDDTEQSSMDILASIGAEQTEDVIEDEGEGTEEVVEDGDAEGDLAGADNSGDAGEGDEEAEGEGDGAGDLPASDEPILGKFKTQEDLMRAYQELERRNREIAERNAEHERYIKYIEQQQAAQQFDYSEPSNRQELMELAYEDPDRAFWFAAERAPNQVANVLAEINTYDPHRAQSLQMAYQQEMMRMQAEEAAAPARALAEQQRAASLANAIFSEVASKPEYNEVKSHIAQLLADPSRQNLISTENPDIARRVVLDAYEIAVLQHQQKTKAVDNARRRQANSAAGSTHVETGGSLETPDVPDENPEEVMRNSIIGAANATYW